MGKWPENDVMAKCCDVYELLNSEISCVQAEDWMLSYEFLNDERTVVLVEEENPDFAYHRTKRLFFGFKGVNLDVLDTISDRKPLLKVILTKYKFKNYFGFQKPASDYLEVALTKLKQLEDNEYNEEFVYEVIFCGHSIGGSIAATAFTNLHTRKRLKAKSPNIPVDSIMTLQNITDDNSNDVCQKFEIDKTDQKVKFESSHEFYCITHGAAMFGNRENKEYCIQRRISAGIFNIIHDKDPVPKLFYHSLPIAIPFIPVEYQNVKANNGYAIGNFLLLQYSNGKFCPKKIDSKDSTSIKEFFMTTKNLVFDMNYHTLDTYKTPVNPGNTDIDVINRMDKDMETLNIPYVCTEFIGEGSYGWVVKATKDNDFFAIKKIKAKYQNNDRDNREIENLGKITNQHVVTFIEHFCFKTTLYLVFEYCSHGSLESYIVSKTDQLKNEEIRDLVLQLLNGLSAVHGQNIIHRDIKPANILVASRKNGKICYKISDFGSSVQYQGCLKHLSAVGTPLYTSPEIYLAARKAIINIKLGEKTDIFSLGAVILFCIKKQTPWNDSKFCALLENGFDGVLDKDFKYIPDDLKAMLTLMIKKEYYKRFSAESLRSHPYIKGERVRIHDKEFIAKLNELLILSIEKLKKTKKVWRDKRVAADISNEFYQASSLLFKGMESASSGCLTDSIGTIEEALKMSESIKDEFLKTKFFVENEDNIMDIEENFRDRMLWNNELVDLIAKCYSFLSKSHFQLGNFDTAIDNIKKQQEIMGNKGGKSRSDYLQMSEGLFSLGRIYLTKSNNEQAFTCLLQSFEHVGNAWSIGNTEEFKNLTVYLSQVDQIETLSYPPGPWVTDIALALKHVSLYHLKVRKLEKYHSLQKTIYNIIFGPDEKGEDFSPIHDTDKYLKEMLFWENMDKSRSTDLFKYEPNDSVRQSLQLNKKMLESIYPNCHSLDVMKDVVLT